MKSWWSALGVGCLAAAACATMPSTAPVELQILAINDFHGNLEPPAEGWQEDAQRIPAGGVHYLASRLQAMREGQAHSIVVSAGDLVGASPLISAHKKDEPTIEVMNKLGLSINGVGNHEFDEGVDELLRLSKLAEFDFLAANVRWKKENQTIFPAYAIREFDGVRVAFIGLTLDTTPDLVAVSLDDLQFENEAETINRLVGELQKTGIEAFVILVHEGGYAQGGRNACAEASGPIWDIVAKLDPAVDLVLSGHTHQAYVCPLKDRWLTSAGSMGRLVTDLRVQLNPQTGDASVISAHNTVVDHHLAADAQIATWLKKQADEVHALASQVVGHNESGWRVQTEEGSPLGKLIANAHQEVTGADLAFINMGGVRSDVIPESKGLIRFGQLYAAQPFDNALVTMSLSGSQITLIVGSQVQHKQRSGLCWSDNLEIVEHHPLQVKLSGKMIEPERHYRVTVNSYLASRPPFEEGFDRQVGVGDLEALVKYVQTHYPASSGQL